MHHEGRSPEASIAVRSAAGAPSPVDHDLCYRRVEQPGHHDDNNNNLARDHHVHDHDDGDTTEQHHGRRSSRFIDGRAHPIVRRDNDQSALERT